MDKLVFIKNNRAVTDSLTVAEIFKKSHDNVIRDIRNQVEKLIEAGETKWSLLNFEETQYQHQQNKQWYPKFDLTEDAFAIVAMSYVTPEAMKMKVRFIEEFKLMRQQIMQLATPSYMIDDPIKRAEKWIQEEKKRQELHIKVEEQAPKVALYDVVVSANNCQTMGAVAKTLGIGRNKLFEFLRNKKVLMANNLPYQEYMDRGYFQVRQYPITHMTKGLENKPQTLVTAKGMDYIAKLLKEQKAV